jgi:hypothetical protein
VLPSAPLEEKDDEQVVRDERREMAMAGKNKGGREARKPKQEKNKKVKGQTPPAGAHLLDGTRTGARAQKG